MEEFNLVDLLDFDHLPLKNRVDLAGYYAPKPRISSLIPEEPLKEGEQYRFHFDMTRCVGCQCCVVACNEQNNNPASVNWRRVGEIEGGEYPLTKRFHLSMACNHCLDPACLTGCPTEAYVKIEKTGVVVHREDECIGCGYCTWNCPYSVPQFNPERNIVTKCDMCHHRLEGNLEPACVAACPEQAIRIEKVSIAEWRENHGEADAPYVPESGITLSTTRITLPADVPANMLRANRHRVEPEKPHTPLIFMTVLTQLAAGGFLTLWLADLFSHLFDFLKPFRDFLVFGAWGMLVVTGLALFASVFHLGRPLHAYKALRMWRRSWLSREVLLFGLFSLSGAVFAVFLLGNYFLGLRPAPWVSLIFGGIVSFLGMAGVFASAKIYLVPARPAWNTVRTPLRFFLTGFILGPVFALLVYSLYGMVEPSMKISGLPAGPIAALLAVSSTAAFVQFLVLLARLIYLLEAPVPELYDSTLLLTRRFKNHFLARFVLLVAGNFVFPFWIFAAWHETRESAGVVAVLTAACFVLSLLGELLGRYLFFVTVVPKNIPGSFFAGDKR